MARKVLVTGASRGIGKSISIALAIAGFDVAIAARTVHEGDPTLDHSTTVHKVDIRPLPGSLEETAREILAAGREALPIRMDLTDRQSVESGIAKIIDCWGEIDVVVNNGRYIGPGLMDTILDTPIEQYQLFVEAHAVAPILIAQLLLPRMLERGNGTFVTISSTAGTDFYPIHVRPGLAYRLGKAAGHTLVGSLLAEYGDRGIRAFNVDPGRVLSERRSLDKDEPGRTPNGPPGAVAAAVAWLLTSPETENLMRGDIEAQSLVLERGLYPDWRDTAQSNE